MKNDADPMRPTQGSRAPPVCAARSKRTGEPCRGAGGARRPGLPDARRGGGGPEGQRNGAWRHGGRSREVVRLRALVRALGKLG